jgi:hypothetical protein
MAGQRESVVAAMLIDSVVSPAPTFHYAVKMQATRNFISLSWRFINL